MKESRNWPKVSIIVLNWNGLEDTIECLNSLAKLKYTNYEIIVVDNGSQGSDVEILRRDYGDSIHLISNDKNYGFADGNNVGMRYALEKGTEYVLLLNNDTIVDPGFLYHLVQAADSDSRIGIAGPKMYYMEPPDVLWHAGGRVNWYLEHWSRGAKKKDRGQFEKVADVDFVAGACMLIRRETINKIGLLPTDYFLQWEDIDYCTNALRHGFRCVYIPQAKIWHKVSASYRRGNKSYPQVVYGIRGRFVIRRKYLSTPKFTVFVACFLLFTTPLYIANYLIRYRDPKKAMSFFRGLREALGGTLANKRLGPMEEIS